MPKNVKCKNCNNLIHDWCEKVIDSPCPDIVRDCQYFWQKTNADIIRAMSDEELADWLAKTQISNVKEALGIAGIPYKIKKGTQAEVKAESLTWLQQPAQEDK